MCAARQFGSNAKFNNDDSFRISTRCVMYEWCFVLQIPSSYISDASTIYATPTSHNLYTSTIINAFGIKRVFPYIQSKQITGTTGSVCRHPVKYTHHIYMVHDRCPELCNIFLSRSVRKNGRNSVDWFRIKNITKHEYT